MRYYGERSLREDIEKFIHSCNKSNKDFLIKKSYEKPIRKNIVFILLMLFSLFAAILTIYGIFQITDRSKPLLGKGGFLEIGGRRRERGGGRMMIMLIALCIILIGLTTIECLGLYKKLNGNKIKLIDELHKSK